MALTWTIAGGGTGGHVTPALALAETIAARGDRVSIIGSERGLEANLVPQAGFELLALATPQVMGRGTLGRLAGIAGIVAQIGRARSALTQCGSDIVISVGGYAAAPVVLAALLRHTPLVLVEPNAVPGRANRMSARFAHRVFVGFERTSQHLPASARIENPGIPLRRTLIESFADAPARERPRPPFHLLIFGGSQGARQLNEAMMEIAPKLAADTPLEIFHQTGEDDRDRVRAAYRDAGLPAEVVAFETDMPARYRWAHLALCRAGALAIAELALARLPALLVPYPHAADDHQRANAQALAAAGAAECLDSRPLNVSALTERIHVLFATPERLQAMSTAAGMRARPRAAEEIVASCVRLLEERRR